MIFFKKCVTKSFLKRIIDKVQKTKPILRFADMEMTMNQGLIKKLCMITEEEKVCLKKKAETDQPQAIELEAVTVDSKKLLEEGRFIQVRPHTRFVHFPEHRQPFIRAVYMCHGQTTHLIGGDTVQLNKGELLFMRPNAEWSCLPAGKSDLAVDMIILPEFFGRSFKLPGDEENLLRDFLVSCLLEDRPYGEHLHFKVAEAAPVQNLMENIVWTIFDDQPCLRSMLQATTELLIMQLAYHIDKLGESPRTFQRDLIVQVMWYIEQNYKDGQLSRLAAWMGYDLYWLSRMIKRVTGQNYKDILQIRRLQQTVYLLLNTKMAVSDISLAVGYDNTSYFHRIFREYYGMSPKEYRRDRELMDRRR